MIGTDVRAVVLGLVALLWAAIERRYAIFHAAAGFPAGAPNVFAWTLQALSLYHLIRGLYADVNVGFVLRLAKGRLGQITGFAVEAAGLLVYAVVIVAIVRGAPWMSQVLLFLAWLLAAFLFLRLRAHVGILPRFWADRWQSTTTLMRDLYRNSLNPQYWGNLHSIYLHEVPLLLVTVLVDFRILPLFLFHLLLRLDQHVRLLQPPLVLYLSSSSRKSLERLAALRFAAPPFRIANLLVDERGALPRVNIGFQDSLRTGHPDEWFDAVRRLLAVSGIIVLDLDALSSSLAREFNEICAQSLFWKTIVVDTASSREALERLALEARMPCATQAVAWLDEQRLPRLVDALKTGKVPLPKPEQPIGASIGAA